MFVCCCCCSGCGGVSISVVHGGGGWGRVISQTIIQYLLFSALSHCTILGTKPSVFSGWGSGRWWGRGWEGGSKVCVCVGGGGGCDVYIGKNLRKRAFPRQYLFGDNSASNTVNQQTKRALTTTTTTTTAATTTIIITIIHPFYNPATATGYTSLSFNHNALEY